MLIRNYTNSLSRHAFICLQLKLKITVSSLKGTTLNGICCIIELLSNVSLYNLGPPPAFCVLYGIHDIRGQHILQKFKNIVTKQQLWAEAVFVSKSEKKKYKYFPWP